MEKLEKTFVLLKPSCIERGFIGEVITRFEKKGFAIKGLKMLEMKREMAERLYEVHKGKEFYDKLIKTVTGRRVVAILLEGRNAVTVVRKMVGATDPANAEPGTIRGDLGLDVTDNIIHASDSVESFQREARIFFEESEILC
ncbi:MAG: nucleoside-diphosphate kinase [Halobacteria archaeon]